MSRYRKIDTRIWCDEKFRDLSSDGKFFFVYLLTSPHSTAWGAYVLDDLYIMADLGLNQKKISECWKEVLKSGLVLRCDKTRIVCFPNWFKYNLPENQRTEMACLRGIQSLPHSPIISKYYESSEWVRTKFAQHNLTVSELLANCSTMSTELGALSTEHDMGTPATGVGKFTPPKVEEIRTYCEERKNGIDPRKFFDHYSARGWMIGKNKMKDWRAAVRTWENNGNNNGIRSTTDEPPIGASNELARKAMQSLKDRGLV